MQILFAPDLAAHRRALALCERVSAEDALGQILNGSGLVARQLRSGAAVIVRAATGAIRDTPPEEVAAQDIIVTAFKIPPARPQPGHYQCHHRA